MIQLNLKSKLLIIFFITLQIFGFSQHSQDSIQIVETINNWHKAAAEADEETYFTILKDGGIFIGTDASEQWTKEIMIEKVKKAFEKESAWDFKLISRKIYFTPKSKKIAWFDELLDTWMGVCQSSGVMEKENGVWKIAHYLLSIAIPNELVKDYLKLLKK